MYLDLRSWPHEGIVESIDNASGASAARQDLSGRAERKVIFDCVLGEQYLSALVNLENRR